MRFVRYWGSKPSPTVLNLILSHSQPGDVVLEPFGGKGSAAIGAITSGRRSIYNDLNPYACFIAKTIATPLVLSKLEDAFAELMRNLDEKEYRIMPHNKTVNLDWIYSTKCKCGAEKKIRCLFWSVLYKCDRRKRLAAKSTSKMGEIARKILEISPRGIFTHNELLEIINQKHLFKRIRPNVITLSINSILIKQGLFRVVGEKPLYITYDTQCTCGLKEKKVSKTDISKLKLISRISSSQYPDDELRYKNGEYFYKRRIVSSVGELFTKRNMIVLSTTRDEIKNLDYGDSVKDALLLILSSILFASSKMQRNRSGSWGIPCYWVPPIFIEKNVLGLLKSRFYTFFRWKEKINGHFENCVSHKAEYVLNGRRRCIFLSEDVRKLPLPDCSIDYIFVDPPQTDEIQYFELSFLAAAWLGFKMPFFDEIIVNPRQGKSEETYWNMLSDALQELNRVLKPKGRMTVLLHGENEKYFRRFRDLLNNYKFKEVSNSFKKYTFKNGLHEKDDKRLNGDYYLTLERIL
jgi:hypothetical protein